MADGMIRNTLVFRFPQGASNPSLVEMARFIKGFDADRETMETSYKISEERCFCIKFKSERAMKDALLQNPECHQFQYSNGSSTEVRMGVMGGCQRYVRVFDLPPEIPDIDIALVLGKYGVVKRTVREKFPAELELDLYTGIRGVYMDIKKEIPAALYFLNRKGRIYYDGLKQKCFQCKKEGHLKVDCPQGKRNHQNQETQPVESQTPGESLQTVELILDPQLILPLQKGDEVKGSLYSDAVKESDDKQGSKAKDIQKPIVLNMTTLVPLEKSPAPVKPSLAQSGVDPDDNEQDPADSEVEEDEMEGIEMVEVEMDGAGKRGLSSSDESTKDVNVEGFTTVKGKSKTKKLAGALEVIAGDSTKQEKKPGGGGKPKKK